MSRLLRLRSAHKAGVQRTAFLCRGSRASPCSFLSLEQPCQDSPHVFPKRKTVTIPFTHVRNRHRMLHKKRIDGLAGVRSLWVGIRTTITAARPGMAHPVDFPIHLDCIPISIIPRIDRVGTPTWNLPCRRARGGIKICPVGIIRRKHICLYPLLYNLVAINRAYRIVTCAVKNNRWYNTCEAAHGCILDRCRRTVATL